MDAMKTGTDTLFILLGAIMVLAMHAGFAFLELGTVRYKNQVNALVKILVDFAVSTLSYFLLGYLVAYGTSFLVGADTLVQKNGYELVKYTIINKYKDELADYDYIDTPELFSTLRLKGSMRYINKFDKNLRTGGLLVKIYNKNGKWIGVILQNNKKYYVSFDANYIFYRNNKSESVRDWADYFITKLDNGEYEY